MICVQFLDECTSILDLPFSARRLFDQKGVEHFNLATLSRDQLVFVTCGEPWSDPTLSKSEQQRHFLLANIAADVAQMKHFMQLRNADSELMRRLVKSRVKLNPDICKAPLNTKCIFKSVRIWQHTVFPAKKPYLPLLPSHRASPPFAWNSFYRPIEGRRLSRPRWLVIYGNKVTLPGVEPGHGSPIPALTGLGVG